MSNGGVTTFVVWIGADCAITTSTYVVWIGTDCAITTSTYQAGSAQEALEMHNEHWPGSEVLQVTDGEMPPEVAEAVGRAAYVDCGWGYIGG